MPLTLRSLINSRYAIVGLLCCLIALVALSASGIRKVGSLTAGANNPAPTQNNTPPPVKVISIAVTSRGFDPSEIAVPEGRYLIDINNRSGIQELDLRFGALNGKKLKESKRLKDKDGRVLKSLDWRGLFNLDKGTYTITESSHPDWVAEIRVDEE
jgi:hypothetical protein